MALLDLKTDLKSIKYGQDRPDGGSSGQPYIQTDINDIDRGFNQLRLNKFDEGLIRGGVIGSTNAAVTDTLRIGKFLTDAPKGPLFIVKQVGLQLSNPKLETRKLPTTTGFLGVVANLANTISNIVPGPTRIYNLGINTLAQVPINHLGGHIVRHGLLPVQDEKTKYEAVVTDNNKNGNNRLLKIYNSFNKSNENPTLKNSNKLDKFINSIISIATTKKINPSSLVIDSYIGGPSSTYGIGTTLIRSYAPYTRTKEEGDEDKKNPSKTIIGINYINTLGVSSDYFTINYPNDAVATENNISNDGNTITYPTAIKYSPTSTTSVAKYIELQNKIEKQNKLTQSYYDGNITGSFTSSISSKDSFITHNSKNYRYYGDKQTVSGSFGSKVIYNNTEVYSRKDADILTVIFRAINPFSDYTNTETIKERWAFSAYINGFRDSFDATWNETNYVGRAESFYIYNKFKRSVSFNLQIPCFNKVELFKKHRALGQLASTTAGSYNNNNLLGGVILQLNVGNYIVGEYAILNSINYEIPNDSAWDVSSNALLAMNINASFNFNIIHKQLPQYTQTSKSNPNTGFFGYLTNPPIPKPNQDKKDVDFFISSKKLKEFTKD
jgi:hypothetical protein